MVLRPGFMAGAGTLRSRSETCLRQGVNAGLAGVHYMQHVPSDGAASSGAVPLFPGGPGISDRHAEISAACRWDGVSGGG